MIRQYRFPLVVLVIALSATAAVAGVMRRAIRQVDQQRFTLAVDGVQDAIAARLETYGGMLRAGAGVASARELPTAEEFHAFAERLDLAQRRPGIQGIGYSARIPADRLDAIVAARRADGVRDFRVWPEHVRDEYHSILYLEPLDRRNREALGYDMFTQSTRREAMERARDTGQPAASGSVVLVQEIDEEKQPGFLIYMPVYGGMAEPQSVAERRAALRGFVYSPFRAGDLFVGILGRNPNPRVGFVLSDGEPGSGPLLYRTGEPPERPRFTATRTIDVAGRRWTAALFSLPSLDATSSLSFVPWLVAGGVAVSFLLAGIALLQSRVRVRAELFREQAERMSHLKDEFLATLSHELRTPLNAIVGWAHMLNTMDMTEERRREAIDVIARNAQAQTKLVEDLLDMSRIVSGRLRLDVQPVDLEHIARAALDVVRPTADAKRLDLRLQSTAAAAPVLGDAARLQQVLWNLLANAIKFTPTGGSVTLALALQGDLATIRVSDTGPGIAPNFLPHVFERFRQGDAGSSRPHGGLGIGLSIARSLVEMHGGRIRVETSAAGAGTTFAVELPVMNAASPTRVPVLRPSSAFNDERLQLKSEDTT